MKYIKQSSILGKKSNAADWFSQFYKAIGYNQQIPNFFFAKLLEYGAKINMD